MTTLTTDDCREPIDQGYIVTAASSCESDRAGFEVTYCFVLFRSSDGGSFKYFGTTGWRDDDAFDNQVTVCVDGHETLLYNSLGDERLSIHSESWIRH